MLRRLTWILVIGLALAGDVLADIEPIPMEPEPAVGGVALAVMAVLAVGALVWGLRPRPAPAPSAGEARR